MQSNLFCRSRMINKENKLLIFLELKVEHCANNGKIMGLIPRESMNVIKCLLYAMSFWIKVAKVGSQISSGILHFSKLKVLTLKLEWNTAQTFQCLFELHPLQFQIQSGS